MSESKETLAQMIEKAPTESGVYLFKNDAGEVLYIGKAKNLRNRVRSYLRPGGDGRFLLQFLGKKASQVEFIVTLSEGEALLVEDNLVKKHLPLYNIRLKDDKSFLMLRLNPNSKFPRFEPVRSRGKKEESSLYFGPYPSSHALRRSLRLLQSLVTLRDCTDQQMNHRSRPCLKHQIGRCSAPCVGLIDEKTYAEHVEQAVALLKGKTEAIEKDLEKKMKDEAEKLNFERAKIYRDQLQSLRETTEKRPVLTKLKVERDVIGLFREEKKAVINVLRFRGGNLSDSRNIPVPAELPDEELLSSFISRFYLDQEVIPEEIIVPGPVNEADLLENGLSEKAGKKIHLIVPQKGERFQQQEMAQQNARQAAIRAKQKGETEAASLDLLRQRLQLAKLPETIDCFDISHIQGTAVVASRVRFANGRADKNGYRRYKIQTVAGNDDFASMLEVVSRSLRRGLEEDDLPDLIVIDGGKGQLSSALVARDEIGAWDVEFIALAKDREKEKEGKKYHTGERVFLPGADEPIALPTGTPELHLMQRIRDEAHRFAITYHRKKRETIRSELDEIAGLGAERKKRLLRHFGSVQAIRESSLEQIVSVPGVSKALAEKILAQLGRN